MRVPAYTTNAMHAAKATSVNVERKARFTAGSPARSCLDQGEDQRGDRDRSRDAVEDLCLARQRAELPQAERGAAHEVGLGNAREDLTLEHPALEDLLARRHLDLHGGSAGEDPAPIEV